MRSTGIVRKIMLAAYYRRRKAKHRQAFRQRRSDSLDMQNRPGTSPASAGLVPVLYCFFLRHVLRIVMIAQRFETDAVNDVFVGFYDDCKGAAVSLERALDQKLVGQGLSPSFRIDFVSIRPFRHIPEKRFIKISKFYFYFIMKAVIWQYKTADDMSSAVLCKRYYLAFLYFSAPSSAVTGTSAISQ